MDKSKYGAVRAERGKKSLPKVEEANNLLDIKYKYEGSQVAKSVKYVKDTKKLWDHITDLLKPLV